MKKSSPDMRSDEVAAGSFSSVNSSPISGKSRPYIAHPNDGKLGQGTGDAFGEGVSNMDGHGKPLGSTNGVGDTEGEGDSALADGRPNQ